MSEDKQPPPYAPPPPPQPAPAQPPYPYPYPPPMAAPVQQQQASVTVVNNTVGGQTVVVKRGINHCMHCCITLFFPFWIIVWIILCITD